MAQSEPLDAVLQALRLSWLRACEAAALHHQAAQAGWLDRSGDGPPVPLRSVIQPPQRPAAPEPLELDWLALCGRRWMRPSGLTLSFDCELRQGGDGSWQLRVLGPDGGRGLRWWTARPRHVVDIVIDGQDDAGGELRFDGQLWRSFGKRPGGPAP